jgi:hypothetical protein
LFSLSPAGGPFGSAHLKKEKKAPGEKLPALTPVPDGVEFGQTHEPVNTIPHKPNRRSQFYKCRQLFIARVTKSFPSSQCASAIRLVRPVESRADTQPQLHPALLRLSAALLIVVDHSQRRSATADSSCGEFARFKSAIGRTRCGELGAHLLDLRRLFLHRCCEGRHS